MPELQHRARPRPRRRPRRVASSDLGETVNALVGGVRVGKFEDRGPPLSTSACASSPTQRSRPEDLALLRVRARRRRARPASSTLVAHRRAADASSAITRRDRERAITIFANVGARALAGRGASTRSQRIAARGPARGLPRRRSAGSAQRRGDDREPPRSRSSSASSSRTWCSRASSTRSSTRSRCSRCCRFASPARSSRSWSPARRSTSSA